MTNNINTTNATAIAKVIENALNQFKVVDELPNDSCISKWVLCKDVWSQVFDAMGYRLIKKDDISYEYEKHICDTGRFTNNIDMTVVVKVSEDRYLLCIYGCDNTYVLRELYKKLEIKRTDLVLRSAAALAQVLDSKDFDKIALTAIGVVKDVQRFNNFILEAERR